jgi:hypothetical protein
VQYGIVEGEFFSLYDFYPLGIQTWPVVETPHPSICTALDDKNSIKRISYLFTCGICSLVVALIVSPLVYTRGLCGLSGIAHGLMAVTGLQMMRNRKDFGIGGLIFLLVVSKSIYELLIGDVLFSFMHMGLCGSPVASCHAGGVLGGTVTFLIWEWIK